MDINYGMMWGFPIIKYIINGGVAIIVGWFMENSNLIMDLATKTWELLVLNQLDMEH